MNYLSITGVFNVENGMMFCLKYISLFPPSCTVCKTWWCKNLPAAVFCKLLDRGRLSDRVVLQEDQIVSEKYCVFFAWRGGVKEPSPPFCNLLLCALNFLIPQIESGSSFFLLMLFKSSLNHKF